MSEDPALVVLADGASIEIRPLAPGDEPLIAAIYERMSPESRRRRFLVAPARLEEEDLRRLTEVDGRRHDALIAIERDTGAAVGEARYVRVPGEPETAEVAAMVVDGWQRRGVASALLERLAERALTAGIRRWTAVVAVDNAPVLQALEREGARRTSADSNEVELMLELPAGGVSDRLGSALCWAGSRQLRLLGGLARRIAALSPR